MKTFYLRSLCTIFTFVLSFTVLGQKAYQDLKGKLPAETVDDPYQYVDRASMPKSAAYNVRDNVQDVEYITRQVNIDGAGNNILNDAGNEPSIAIDPTNPNRIVIGWRQFDVISSNFRQAGYGYSTDGGLTWAFPGPLTPGTFRSDPVLDYDVAGNFYYNSLQDTFNCDVFAIRNGGTVWGPPVPAQGGDKQWMRIDRSDGTGPGHNYSYWNRSFSVCSGAFTRSTNEANSFENCVEIIGSPFWGTLAVNTTGDLFLTGTTAAGISIIKSTNAKDPGQTVMFDSTTPVNLDGDLNVGQPINPQGLIGQTWVDVDMSTGPGRDNVYVLASVERFSVADPADVMFAKSTDGGATFLPPVRINTDTEGNDAYQWFGTMSVAPNGRIDVIWLDTRDAPSGTFASVLYYSFSEDQGSTWSDNLAISEPFDPTIGYPQQSKMGDYFDMKSSEDFAHVAWCATFTGGQDVYYTKISPEGTLGLDGLTAQTLAVSIAPN
ncbi:MAG: sialidase family protein, partial [Marinirhabdus sp.]